MQGAVKARILYLLAGLIIVPLLSVVVILFAKGYRPDLKDGKIKPTGLLVAQSNPNGAQIYINGVLRSATNNTLSLEPGKYTVEIKKDGFSPWKKDLQVEAELVTKASAWIFPNTPNLRAISSTGAINPVASPESGKVAFGLKDNSISKLFTIDLSEFPLGSINRDAKLVYTTKGLDITKSQIVWSPDSKEILISASSSAIVVDTSTQQTRDVTGTVPQLIDNWKQLRLDLDTQKLKVVPEKLRAILATSADQLNWSPKENKILYTATASADIPDHLITPLPGSNTQEQNRHLTPGNIYVYDLEEDRNFQLGTIPTSSPTPKPKSSTKKLEDLQPNLAIELGYTKPGTFAWFPSSAHLIRVEDNKIIITEYDGQNPTVVYSGPMENSFAAPYPSGNNILILTNLNPTNSPLPNLYAVSLR